MLMLLLSFTFIFKRMLGLLLLSLGESILEGLTKRIQRVRETAPIDWQKMEELYDIKISIEEMQAEIRANLLMDK